MLVEAPTVFPTTFAKVDFDKTKDLTDNEGRNVLHFLCDFCTKDWCAAKASVLLARGATLDAEFCKANEFVLKAIQDN